MKGYIAAIRGYNLLAQGMMPQGAEFLRSSLKLLPAEDAATRSLAATVLSTSLRWMGHLAESARYGEEAVAMARRSGSVNALVDVLADLSKLQTMQGQLKQAFQTCQMAIEAAGTYTRPHREKLPVLGPIYMALSVILHEWNQIEAALPYAKEGLLLCQRWGQVPNIFRAYSDLAKTLHIAGDEENALRAIQEAEKIASSFAPWMVERATVLRVWHHVVTGNIAAAALWEQTGGARLEEPFRFEYFEHYSLLANVILAEGRAKDALALSNRLLEMADSAGAGGYVVDVLAIQALCFYTISGDGSDKRKMEAAMACLERALALAEPEGFVRTFVDKGGPMAALLRQAHARGIRPGYVERLLRNFEGRQNAAALETLTESRLIEPLSRREMEVLQLLAQGCSDKQIAESLVIARETVHIHLKNIYG
jgi:LuxR family maltose regulon positive regulatory protein